MAKNLSKIEETRFALNYFRQQRENLEMGIRQLMNQYQTTNRGWMVIQELRVQAKLTNDAEFLLKEYLKSLGEEDNISHAPKSGPGDVQGHKELRDESTFERRKNNND